MCLYAHFAWVEVVQNVKLYTSMYLSSVSYGKALERKWMRGLEPQQVFKWLCRCVCGGERWRGLNHLWENLKGMYTVNWLNRVPLSQQKKMWSRSKEGKKLNVHDQVLNYQRKVCVTGSNQPQSKGETAARRCAWKLYETLQVCLSKAPLQARGYI